MSDAAPSARHAPELSEAEVRSEVERVFRSQHRSHLLALFGRGQPCRFERDGESWEIIPTVCELELRARLPAPGAPPQPRRVYLIDWAEHTLPLDLAGRLAGGRIYHVAHDARLRAMFGAREVEPGLAGTALARLVLAGGVDGLRKIGGLCLTADELWLRVLEARLRIPEGQLADGGAWLGWARRDDSGPAFARACEADDLLRAVRRELAAWLERRLGAVGSLGLRAWELGQADRVVQALVLLVSAERTDDGYFRGLVDGQLAALAPGLTVELRAAASGGAGPTLLGAVLSAGDEADRRLLEGAERQLVSVGAERLAAASEWLPAGHAAREEAAAAALHAFVAQRSPESLAAVLTALTRLTEHRLDGALRGSEHAEARTMAARLAAWLLARQARPPLAAYGTPWQPALELARRYSEEGGFVDWARQCLRGFAGAGAGLTAAVRQLREAVDEAARADDRCFAEGYLAWLDAGRPSHDVVPIEQVAHRLVAQFLEGGPRRRLLLVLMDGMSCTAAVQLLQRLRDQRRWSPIAWRTRGWGGQLPIPPVLAAAPTLTEVSRAALFAGVADPRFGDQGTDRDEARWAANPHLRKLTGEQTPALFVRRDLQAGHELTAPIKAAIDGQQGVVAVVVNAIDEQLKGSLQVAVDYRTAPILPLDALLSAADGAERAVLLVADHGHAPGDAMAVAPGRLQAGREGGARWRALSDGEAPEPGEVCLPATCWKPRGAARVAVLWDTSLANRAPRYGEHGGLSLAEAVAPAYLIAPEWLDRVDGDDPDLSCRALPEPDWWALSIARGPAVMAPTGPQPTTPEPQSLATQLELIPASTAKVPTSPPPAPTEPPLVARLRASKLFSQQIAGTAKPDVERLLGWLSVLIHAGGTLPALEFARLCGMRPHQVGGAAARMGILNADGFAIVEHDVAGRRVLIHKARLLSQFSLKEE